MRGEAFVETKEREKVMHVCNEMLQGIRNFDVDSLREKTLQECISEILKNSALKADNYDVLNKDGLLKKFIGHDLNNMANIILGYREALYSSKTERAKERAAEMILKYWQRFSLIMEDICLRGIDNHSVDKKYFRKFDFVALEESMDLLEQSLRDKLKDKRFNISNIKELSKSSASHIVSPSRKKLDISIKLDEERLDFPKSNDYSDLENVNISVAPGVVVNALNNIIRNAAGEYIRVGESGKPILDEQGNPEEIGAELINVSIFKEENYVIFRVVDDGKGMTPDYLTEGTKTNIFAEGRSHRQSSGYGLTNMQQRLGSMGVNLRVLSFAREVGKVRPALFESDHSDAVEGKQEDRDNLDDILQNERMKVARKVGFAPSTIFEIKIPITKKTK